jgi:hypothetical protein
MHSSAIEIALVVCLKSGKGRLTEQKIMEDGQLCSDMAYWVGEKGTREGSKYKGGLRHCGSVRFSIKKTLLLHLAHLN